MVKLTTKLINVVCRTCLSVKDVSNLFEATCAGVNVVHMLEECTLEKVTRTDGTPPNICLNCIAILYQSYSFLKMCKKSSETVKELLEMERKRLRQDHNYAKDAILCLEEEVSKSAETLRNNQLSVIQNHTENERKVVSENIQVHIIALKPVLQEALAIPQPAPVEEEDDVIFLESEPIPLFIDLVAEEEGNSLENSIKPKLSPKPKITFPKPQVAGQATPPQITVPKPQITFSKPQITIPKPKPTFIKPKITFPKPTVNNENRHVITSTFAKNLSKLIQDYKNFKEKCICPVCDETLRTKRSLGRHLKSHMVIIKKDLMKCYKCEITFKNAKEIKEHCKTTKHLDKTCQFCKKTFKKLAFHHSHMQLHKSTVHYPKEPRFGQRKRTYYCKPCKLTYDTFKDVFTHYNSEHSDSKSCIICERLYTSPRLVQYHINKHRPPRLRNTCRSCRTFFDSYEELQEHLKSDEHQNWRYCKLCNKLCKTRYHLNLHLMSHTQERQYQCDECGKRFIYENNLNRHKQVHAGRRFPCDICNKEFTTNYILKKHINIIHNKTGKNEFRQFSYMCTYCGKLMKSQRAKILHIAKHELNHTSICSKCNKTFATRQELKQHTNEQHEVYSCTLCKKTTLIKSVLTNHMKTHDWQTNEDNAIPNCCRLCPETFENNQLMLEHVNSNHSIYPCSECSRCYIYKSELQQHTVVHSGEYKWVCNFCGKGFQQAKALRTHEYLHTDKRPYQCPYCEKAFRQTPHLKAHINVHTGVKPYVCRFCEKAFTHSTSLIIHERIHTGERPYRCEICDKGFCHSSTMKKHRLIHFKKNAYSRNSSRSSFADLVKVVTEDSN